jgi:hypothetical protein
MEVAYQGFSTVGFADWQRSPVPYRDGSDFHRLSPIANR